jgi:hypothetical protein
MTLAAVDQALPVQGRRRMQSLRTAVQESGGSVPGNMTTPGARVNYSQSDITQLESYRQAA